MGHEDVDHLSPDLDLDRGIVRRLRLVADTRGFVLDDHGLFPAVRDIHGQKVNQLRGSYI